jgi:type II secretory pathway pseudopilin PulG
MNLHRREGFLLLEVILATSLLAVGLFALITSLGRCLTAAQSVKNYTIAQTLLANKSYEFRVEQPTDYLDQEGDFEDYPNFTWSRRFEPVDLDPDYTGLWQQTITVAWRESGQIRTDAVVELRYLPDKQR